MLRNRVFAFTIIVALVNAMIRPILADIESIGLVESAMNGFGISFVVWFSIFCSLQLLLKSRELIASSRDVFTCLIILTLLCIPSSFLAWLIIASFCLYITFFARGLDAFLRNGVFIMMAVALRVPVSDICLKLSADFLLQFDGVATVMLSEVLGIAASRQGNIILGQGGHELLIMTGCASFTNISLALLLWFTIIRLYAVKWSLIFSAYILPLCIGVMAINILRLSLMAISVEQYHFYHDEIGADILNAAVLVYAFLLAWAALHTQKMLRLDKNICSDIRAKKQKGEWFYGV